MESEKPRSRGVGTEGQTRMLLVKQLERLVRLRSEYQEDLNPLGLRLMDRAIYATYRDCLEYGAGRKARALMAKHTSRTELRLALPEWEDGRQRRDEAQS